MTFTVKDIALGIHEVKVNELNGTLNALYANEPVLSLSFDKSDETTAADGSPYGYHGTLNGNVSYQNGKIGSALKLNGGWVEVPSAELLNGGSAFTIGLWMNLENAGTDQKVIGKTSIGDGYVLGVDGGLYPEVWNESRGRLSFNEGEIPSNTWTHVALTYQQSGQLTGYINGQEVASTDAGTFPIGDNNHPLIIGGAPWGPGGLQMRGLVDEVKLYKQALSKEEIQKLYQSNSIK